MDPNLDEELCARHQRIFAERHGDPATTAMCWGFEVGNGWFTLLYVLCNELQRETDEARAPQVIAQQVKAKGASLRFHVASSNDRQYAMIDLAQALSRQTCDICGAPGSVDERIARAHVLCAACRDRVVAES